MTRSRVVLADGMTLSLTEWHDAPSSATTTATTTREPVVLLHGLGDASGVWLGIAPWLLAQRRVLGVDLRGHGESAWSGECDYRTDTHVRDLAGLLDVIGLERVTLVGHSLGGAVALAYAARFPRRVGNLVIVDHGPEVAEASSASILDAIRESCRVYPGRDDFAAVLHARHPLGDAGLLTRIAATLVRDVSCGGFMVKHDPAVVRDAEPSSAAADDRDDTWGQLRRLRARTLIVRGMASSVLPRAVACRMLESIDAEAHLETIRMAGHSVHLDNTTALRESLVRFLA
ncbi:alpha/beta fold hydrolase [Burkholderia gladioli]|uniref:alpha/beta fold hydrolase n=1 Tax=Burkholderia gladioli TaxID=28095 RepID=UPI001641BA24|nr:alpha/beta hydrolase [Burkholderia gladioli]